MNKALETVKQVTVTFAIPEDWDAEDFIMELAAAYDDANREAAEQVEYTVDSTNKITRTTKGNK